MEKRVSWTYVMTGHLPGHKQLQLNPLPYPSEIRNAQYRYQYPLRRLRPNKHLEDHHWVVHGSPNADGGSPVGLLIVDQGLGAIRLGPPGKLREQRDTADDQANRMGMPTKEEDRADQIKERCESLEKRCESLQEKLTETQSQLWVVRWENYDNKIEQILERNTREWEKTLLDLQ